MSRRKRKRFFAKLIICLISAAVILYAGIIGYICIREGGVPETVPEANEYEAIIVLGAQVKPDRKSAL